MESQNSSLRCGVIGVGYLGRFHAQKYKELEKSEGIELAGVFDQDQKRSNEVAGELGINSFSSINEVLENCSAVTIAASTDSHYELTKRCLEAGLHVNVEKPMTSTLSQGEEVVRIAKDKGLKLQVGHVERFNPAFQVARKKLSSPLFIEVHRLAPFKPRGVEVSVVLDLMIHDIDVVLALVDSPVKSISAVGTPVLTQTIDIANARIEFESGATANLTASRASQVSTRKFRVFEKNKYLSLDFGAGEIKVVSKIPPEQFDPQVHPLPIQTENLSLEKGDALLEETRSFVRSILDNKECEVTGENGLIALQLAEQVAHEINQKL